MPHPLEERLGAGVLLCDGGTGTLLHARGVPHDACFEALNLQEPALVAGVHADFLAAGADLVETNTFGANRVKLAAHGLGDRVGEVNQRGARLAREARESVGRDALVLGSIGPLGRYLAPLGPITADGAHAAFGEQAEGLLAGGVDGFIVETFSDLAEVALAIEAVRGVSGLPIIAQMAFRDDGQTFTGLPGGEVARALAGLRVAALGANCAVGSSTLFEVLEQLLASAGRCPVAVQPNAGLPARHGERLLYVSSPAYMAEWAVRMVEAGARLVGGCCGTTPEHIAAMREALDRLAPARRPSVRRMATPAARRPLAVPGAEAQPTTLERKLAARQFVVSVELDPPRGHGLEKLVEGATRLKARGVEVVDINDGSLGRVRMAVLPTALLVRDSTGLDITLHVTCRDRNLMGLQADLLGAQALGLRNVLAMTGDPPRPGDYVNTTAVFDVDVIGLLEVVRRLNRGEDATGNAIGAPTAFFAGATLSPSAVDPERECERLRQKLAAGAAWIQTQPVFDLDAFDAFVARAGGLSVPVLVGVLPLHSLRHAEFLHNEVPGITVPEEVRARLAAAGEHALSVGIALAQELVRGIRARGWAGAYLMPSFGRYEVVAEVLDALD